MPRLLAAVILTVAATVPAFPADSPIQMVEDWSRQPASKTGIPDGWTGHDWGGARYEFTVIADGSQTILRMRSRGDNSTISKAVALDIRRFPILVWHWKVVTLPAGGDSRRRHADDQAAQVYVTFARFPEKVRSRVIGYVWDTTAPAGAIVKSTSASAVTYVIVRSGEAGAGRWWTERRNVSDDYRRIYGEEPPEKVSAVSIAIDSNDTRSSAESYIGAILFRSP